MEILCSSFFSPFYTPTSCSVNVIKARPHSVVSNMSESRNVSDCRSRDREFDPGSVQYFRGD